MTLVHIQSFVRLGEDHFLPVGEVRRFTGDCDYVPGAIVMSVGGVEVLSLDLWDDVNWLWPFVIKALDECRRSGVGERDFPDQPLTFRVEALGTSDQLSVSVTGGPIDRRSVGPARDIYREVARAGLKFFTEIHRLCPEEASSDQQDIATLEAWLAPDDR